MKPRYAIIHGLSMLTLGIGVAVAQEGERKGPPGGGDGAARLAEYIKRADKDGDGKISKEEFVTMSKAEAEERFAKVDGNGDGYADQAEIVGAAERLREGARNRGMAGGGSPGAGGEGGFRRPPGDRPEGSRGDRPQGDRPEGRPEGRPPGGGGPQGGPNMEEVFSRIDKNSDGSIDKEEYAIFSKEEGEQRFTRMDDNTDGKVSKEEMRNAMERMRGMMRGPGGQGGPGGPGAPGGFRRPGGEGGEGGFRRPPSEGGDRPRPEGEAAKKDAA